MSYFYQSPSWAGEPEIWASLGLIAYFACLVTYFSLFDYLNRYYEQLSLQLLFITTYVLSNVRYLMLAVSFWLARRKSLLVLK